MIRKHFGVRDRDFIRSWEQSQGQKKSKSIAKGGAHFIHSTDRLFILKTLASHEVEQLRKLIHEYKVRFFFLLFGLTFGSIESY